MGNEEEEGHSWGGCQQLLISTRFQVNIAKLHAAVNFFKFIKLVPIASEVARRSQTCRFLHYC
jgi:hypothetical protein